MILFLSVELRYAHFSFRQFIKSLYKNILITKVHRFLFQYFKIFLHQWKLSFTYFGRLSTYSKKAQKALTKFLNIFRMKIPLLVYITEIKKKIVCSVIF